MTRNSSPQQARQQPPDKPPLGWMLRRSLWILPAVFGLGYISFVSYFWLAKKWRSPGMNAIALVLLGLSILYLPFTLFNDDVDETQFMHIFLWIGPVLLGLYINPGYLRTTWRREMLGQEVPAASNWFTARLRNISGEAGAQNSERAASQGSTAQAGASASQRSSTAQPASQAARRSSAVPLAAQEVRRSSSPQPRFRSWDEIDTQRAFGTVGLVDLATASVDQLEVLPFISRSRAEQLVALRDRDMVRDITDVIAALDLQPHEAAAIRSRLSFVQTPPADSQPAGSPHTVSPHTVSPHTPAERQQKPAKTKPPRQGRILDV